MESHSDVATEVMMEGSTLEVNFGNFSHKADDDPSRSPAASISGQSPTKS